MLNTPYKEQYCRMPYLIDNGKTSPMFDQGTVLASFQLFDQGTVLASFQLQVA